VAWLVLKCTLDSKQLAASRRYVKVTACLVCSSMKELG
jgi:hypothetical protein